MFAMFRAIKLLLIKVFIWPQTLIGDEVNTDTIQQINHQTLVLNQQEENYALATKYQRKNSKRADDQTMKAAYDLLMGTPANTANNADSNNSNQGTETN